MTISSLTTVLNSQPRNHSARPATRSTADSGSPTQRYASSCSAPLIPRLTRSECTSTWNQTTSKPRSADSKRSAPPGTTTSKNAATTSGSSVTLGTTSSASFRSTFLTCSPNARLGPIPALPNLALIDQGPAQAPAGGACPPYGPGRAASIATRLSGRQVDGLHVLDRSRMLIPK